MRAKQFSIDRYHPAENEIIKRYISVVPAERDFLPLFNFSSTRRGLLREVRRIIEAEAQSMYEKRTHALNSMSYADQELFDALDDLSESSYAPDPAPVRVSRWVNRLSNRTLELIIDRFGEGQLEGLAKLLEGYGPSREASIRELLMFHDTLKELSEATARRVLDDVRTSGEDFKREDLSELPEELMAEATAIMTVSRDLFLATTDGSAPSSMIQRMSKGLARVAVEYPDRSLDIVDYMVARNLTAADVDPAALRDYLSTPTRSLNSGVL